MALPEGTLTFLLTDVEGSTRLWEEQPESMSAALADHDELVARIVAAHGGHLRKTRGEGDSSFSVFPSAAGAVAAVLEIQQGLRSSTAGGGLTLSVRAALHTGEAEIRGDDYYGSTVNRCARLRAVAHGGQVVLSQATAELVGDRGLPEGARLVDLGVHRLRDLARPEQIFQLCHAGLPTEFPPLLSLDARLHNLPVQLTRFIGRERQLAELAKLIDSTRLVTLTGIGGAGKTRLALEAAADALDRRAGGAWLVELSSLADPALVPDACATALGVQEEPGRALADSVVDHLRGRDALLVLDNCEHVVASAAALADVILRGCPSVAILATSRQPLGVAGELTWPVPPLTLPDEDEASEAVGLFLDRAGLVAPDFVAEVDRVARICERLDGIPLAIELAAARVRVLDLAELERRLDDRFAVLTGGTRTAEPRQQTLRAAIDWSYDLLAPEEQRAFRTLSVFPGGFTLDAAEAVAGTGVLDALSALVEQSLVAAGEGRYSMLETVRAYALERLADAGETGGAHERLLDWSRSAAPTDDYDHLEREHDNLRAALAFGSEARPVDALELAARLGRFWEARGHWAEGRRWLSDLLERAPEAESELWIDVHHFAGKLATCQGHYPEATRLFEAGLAAATRTGDHRLQALLLSDLGTIAHRQGDVAAARRRTEAALELYRSIGHRRGIAGALGNLGIFALARGDLERARELLEESAEMLAEFDDFFFGAVLSSLGMVSRAQGRHADARAMYERSLAIARRQGNLTDVATVLGYLGSVAEDEGDRAAARAHFEEALALLRALGEPLLLANALYQLGDLERGEENDQSARQLLDEALAISRSLGYRVGEAAQLLSLGQLEIASGGRETGFDHLRAALALFRSLESREGQALVIEALSSCAAVDGDEGLAAELAATAAALRGGDPVDGDAVERALAYPPR